MTTFPKDRLPQEGRASLQSSNPPEMGLQFKGQNLAVFPKKSHAIRAAVAIAYATATPDAPTTVLDKGSGGESYTLWTYGKDAYTAA